MRTTWRFILVSVVLVGALALAPSESAAANAQRAALVVGNAAYPDGDDALRTPLADADVISRALSQRDYDVETVKNGNKKDMMAAISRFMDRIGSGTDVAIFFAGHGIQVTRKNYLVPVDARIWNEADVLRDGIAVDAVLADAARKGARTRVVMLDASRRNPFERRFRSLSAGLAAAAPRPGVMTISSAAAGTVVADADGPNSAFASELRKQIDNSTLTAEQAFDAARDGVARSTQNAQVPIIVSGLEAPFFFDPSRKASDIKVASPQITAPPPTPPPATKPVPETPSKQQQTTKLELPPEPQSSGTKAAVDSGYSTPSSKAAPEMAPEPRKPAKEAALPPEPRKDVAPPPAVTTTSVPPPPYSADDMAQKGRLDAIIARNPRDAEALSDRGQLLAQHGDFSNAFSDFDRVVKLTPRAVEALNNRCFVRAVRNDLQAALTDCNEALRLRRDYADAYDSRALVFLKIGQTRAALSDYDSALKIDPSHSSALYGRGVARLRLGEKAQAEQDFSSALGLNGTIDRVYAQFGVQ